MYDLYDMMIRVPVEVEYRVFCVPSTRCIPKVAMGATGSLTKSGSKLVMTDSDWPSYKESTSYTSYQLTAFEPRLTSVVAEFLRPTALDSALSPTEDVAVADIADCAKEYLLQASKIPFPLSCLHEFGVCIVEETGTMVLFKSPHPELESKFRTLNTT